MQPTLNRSWLMTHHWLTVDWLPKTASQEVKANYRAIPCTAQGHSGIGFIFGQKQAASSIKQQAWIRFHNFHHGMSTLHYTFKMIEAGDRAVWQVIPQLRNPNPQWVSGGRCHYHRLVTFESIGFFEIIKRWIWWGYHTIHRSDSKHKHLAIWSSCFCIPYAGTWKIPLHQFPGQLWAGRGLGSF